MKELLTKYALRYNRPEFFEKDPVIFPKKFAKLSHEGKASLQDVEIVAVIAAHLAWGRRNMIVNNCNRAFDEMQWQPYQYIMEGEWRNERTSLHRTVKWCDFAEICSRLRNFYMQCDSLESLTPDLFRTEIYGQKSNPKAANKKIHLLRRWMIRDDGIVDLGVWKNSSPADLIIPLDVHVHRTATMLGITSRKSTDLSTALEITSFLKEIFPTDPCKGDFALFGYGITHQKEKNYGIVC